MRNPCQAVERVERVEIKIKLGEPLWRTVGQRRLQITWPDAAPPTIAELVAYLDDRYAGFAQALALVEGITHANPYQFFVDSRLVAASAIGSRRLQTGETVYIFLPAAGGEAYAPLPRSFFARSTPVVAADLLGRLLVRVLPDGTRLCGRIVETEAYGGAEDLASHAARGPTPRAAIMFGEPGRAYIYFIYGMYFCCNVVTEAAGTAGAVLLRALEMVSASPQTPHHACGPTDGPGKLCRALHIDRGLGGQDLTSTGPLYLAAGQPLAPADIVATPRINVRADERGRMIPWRFVIRGP